MIPHINNNSHFYDGVLYCHHKSIEHSTVLHWNDELLELHKQNTGEKYVYINGQKHYVRIL